jgi:hypothetical protein
MARRGMPSEAHEYVKDVCKHCSMIRSNVERMSHVCKAWREALVDEEGAARGGLSLFEYKLGRDLESTRALVGRDALIDRELKEILLLQGRTTE